MMHTDDMLRDRKKWRTYGVLGLLCATFLFWMARDEYQDMTAFNQDGVVATAEITKKEEDGDKRYISYRFVVGEKEFTVDKDYVDSDTYHSVDDTIEIQYLASNPDETRLVEDEFEVYEFFWIGMVLLGVGGAMGLSAPIGERWQSRVVAKLIINARYFFGTLGVMSVAGGIITVTDRSTGIVSQICFSTCLFIAVVLIFQFLGDLGKILQSKKDALTRKDTDVTSENRPLPAGKYNIGEQLAMLGFQRLGETDRNIPDEADSTTWYFHNLDFTIIASVVRIMEMASFDTWLGDKHCVQTMFPRGERIRTQDYWADFTEESVEVAYQRHLEHVQQFEHGMSLPRQSFTSIAAVTTQDQYYMKHFFARFVRRNTTVMWLRVWFGMYLLLFAIGFIYSYSHFADDVLWTYLLIGSLMAFVFQVLPGWLLNYRRTPIQFTLVEKEIKQQEQAKSDKLQLEREHWANSFDELFPEETLAVNRQHQITDEQRNEIKHFMDAGDSIWGNIVIFIGSTLGAIGFVLASFGERGDQLIAAVLLGIIAIYNVVSAIRKAQRTGRYEDSIKRNHVVVLNRVKKSEFSERIENDHIWFEYQNDPHLKLIDEYDIMDDDSTYCIYYWSAPLHDAWYFGEKFYIVLSMEQMQ